MKEIKINVADKVASAVGSPVIVCGNSNYKITFIFDSEWGAYQEKTARFTFKRDGIDKYIDVLFSGTSCTAPVLNNIERVSIGVYAGNLRTTTGAEIRCRKSILCGTKAHEKPNEDVYNKLLELINQKENSANKVDEINEKSTVNQYPSARATFNFLKLQSSGGEPVVNTASGELVKISDSSERLLQGARVYGKTRQDETTGKNLLPYPYSHTTKTTQGVTFTDLGDGGIKVQGTCTATTSGVFLFSMNTNVELLQNLVAGETYTISSGGSTLKPEVWLYYTNEDGETRIKTVNDTFTMEEKYIQCSAMLNVEANTTYNTIVYPMVRLSSITDDTYEKYSGGIASPNPYFPQEIKSIVDSGSLEVCGKNLLENKAVTTTKNGVTFTVNEDKSITINGTTTATTMLNVNTDLKLDGTYILSGCSSVASSQGLEWLFYDGAWQRDMGSGKTFTTSKAKAQKCVINIPSGKTITNATIYPMIRFATITDSTYEPYTKQTLSIPSDLQGLLVSGDGNYTDESGQMWISDVYKGETGTLYKHLLSVTYDGSEDEGWLINKLGYVEIPLDSPCKFLGTTTPVNAKSNIFATAISSGAINSGKDGFGVKDNGNLAIKITGITSNLASWKDYIKSTPITVLYELETPTKISAYDEAFDEMQTYMPNTTVYAQGLGVEIDYVADTKMYIDNKFEELKNAIISIGGNV